MAPLAAVIDYRLTTLTLVLFLLTYFNPRTYKQFHTPTVVQEGREVDRPPPCWFYVVLQYFEIMLLLEDSL